MVQCLGLGSGLEIGLVFVHHCRLWYTMCRFCQSKTTFSIEDVTA